MMRPFPIAASLVIAVTALAASAQHATSPETQEATPATAQTAPATTSAAETAPAATAPLVGDIERGRDLTFTCMGCHGITGYQNAYPTYHVPLIGGQSEQYLINALTEYKQGQRSHPTMQAQAESFSGQQIADIAAFLSSVKK